MFVLTVIVSLVAAAVFAFGGVTKLQGVQSQVDAASHFGIPWSRYRMIGIAEVLGAAGLVIGIWVGWLGVLAALCLLLLMIGAVVVHSRAGDRSGQMAPAIGVGVLALLALLLNVAT